MFWSACLSTTHHNLFSLYMGWHSSVWRGQSNISPPENMLGNIEQCWPRSGDGGRRLTCDKVLAPQCYLYGTTQKCSPRVVNSALARPDIATMCSSYPNSTDFAKPHTTLRLFAIQPWFLMTMGVKLGDFMDTSHIYFVIQIFLNTMRAYSQLQWCLFVCQFVENLCPQGALMGLRDFFTSNKLCVPTIVLTHGELLLVTWIHSFGKGGPILDTHKECDLHCSPQLVT